jgi:hypothetical protein
VIVQGSLRLGDDCRGETVLADQQHGVERMTQPSQILALPFRKFHGADFIRNVAKIAGCMKKRGDFVLMDIALAERVLDLPVRT